jgi:hypothetical protein
VRQRLDHRQPAPAAREHDPQQALDRPGLLQQCVDLVAQGGQVELQPQAVAGALQARVVVVHGERAAAVEAGHLERAVAAQQAFVGDRDARLGEGADRAVEAREHPTRVSPVAPPPRLP